VEVMKSSRKWNQLISRHEWEFARQHMERKMSCKLLSNNTIKYIKVSKCVICVECIFVKIMFFDENVLSVTGRSHGEFARQHMERKMSCKLLSNNTINHISWILYRISLNKLFLNTICLFVKIMFFDENVLSVTGRSHGLFRKQRAGNSWHYRVGCLIFFKNVKGNTCIYIFVICVVNNASHVYRLSKY
jgi:hypothetical protein